MDPQSGQTSKPNCLKRKGCCVPGCPSKMTGNKVKETGIHFHQFPSNYELCLQWLKLIRREDFDPYATGGDNSICSKHFLPSDYISNFKRPLKVKRLCRNAVPSQFLGFPKYLQPTPKKMRKSTTTGEREQLELDKLNSVKETGFARKTVVTSKNSLKQLSQHQPQMALSTHEAQQFTAKPSGRLIIINQNSLDRLKLSQAKGIQETEPVPNDGPLTEPQKAFNKNFFVKQLNISHLQKADSVCERKPFTIERVESVDINDFNKLSSPETLPSNSLTTNVGTSYFHQSVQASPNCSNKVTAVNLTAMQHKRRIRGYQKKLSYYVNKMKEVKDKMKTISNEYSDLKNRRYIRSVVNIAKDAENGDQSASYLMSLIINYHRNKYKCVDIPIENLIGTTLTESQI